MAKRIIGIRRSPIRNAVARFRTIFIFTLSVLLAPVFVLLLLPVFSFRYVLFKLAPHVRPDLGKMISARSSLFVADDIYNRPLCTIVTRYVTEGTLDIVRVREAILKNWINAKSANGALQFEELTQYVSYWFGFPFWKKDQNFNIAEHIKLFQSEGKCVTESEATVYMNTFGLKPFDRMKSPWEMTIIPKLELAGDNDGKPKSAAILRVHHSLSDGFGIRKLTFAVGTPVLDSSGKETILDSAMRTQKRKSCLKGFFEGFYLALRAPYDLFKFKLEMADPIKPHSWHEPQDELIKRWTTSLSEKQISCELVKEVKNSFGVSFNAVVMAAIAGSLRNFMLSHPDKILPDFIHTNVPLPMMPHPGKLRNFWMVSTIRLPLGENSPRKRLLYIEKELQKVKKSPSPSALFLCFPVIGSLSVFLPKSMLDVKNVTAIVSNMPGPKGPLDFLGLRLIRLGFHVGLGPGNLGFSVTSVSCDGIISIGATVDNGLISNLNDVDSLTNNVCEQVLVLKECNQDLQV